MHALERIAIVRNNISCYKIKFTSHKQWIMRKKILILGHNDATQFIDIYNQYTRLFNSEQYEVTVAYLTGSSSEETRKRTIAEHCLFLEISKKNIRSLKWRAIQKLFRLCKENRYQMVICHRYKPTYIMMWIAQFLQIPSLVFVMHELNTMASFGRKLVVAALARKNMFFAGVSNAVRDDIRKDLWFMPNKRIVTLYNMMDTELTEPQLLTREEARAQLNLSPDAIVFGNVARLVPNKDQANLIRAFSLIKPYCPKAVLILIGSGPLEAELKQQVENLKLTERVIFTGFLNNGFKYMKAFDYFVLSSKQEAFGRVLLEAMLAQTPIIAAKSHGIPEVVGDVGVLVKPQDARALAESMKQAYLLSSSERGEWAKKAYDYLIENFSISAFNRQFWELPFK